MNDWGRNSWARSARRSTGFALLSSQRIMNKRNQIIIVRIVIIVTSLGFSRAPLRSAAARHETRAGERASFKRIANNKIKSHFVMGGRGKGCNLPVSRTGAPVRGGRRARWAGSVFKHTFVCVRARAWVLACARVRVCACLCARVAAWRRRVFTPPGAWPGSLEPRHG